VKSALALLLGLVSCGEEDNYLDGSVQLSLGFERVTARLIEDDLSVSYLRDASGGVEKTAELVVEDVGPSLGSGFEAALGQENAVVGRSVTDGSTFPDVVGGTLRIEEGGAVGEVLRGTFGVEFLNGSTLRGGWRARLESLTP